MNQSNEEVLGRLDALLNRDKTAAPEEATIPLLTEIYQPVAPKLSLSPAQIEQLVELLLPEMHKAVQDSLETALRQRLQALMQ